MAPPKKTVKMDLNSFLNDDTFGSSWAEDEVDLNKINIPIENTSANTIPLEEIAAAKKAGAMGGMGGRSRLDPALGGARSFEREEYPVPNAPPYRAIINNIPWDISPEGVQAWVEDGLGREGAVEEVSLPASAKDPTRLKGIAFITLKERDDLVKALTFNATKLNERTVYVSVAAPRREGFRSGGDDFDWGSARGSGFQASRDEPDLDWGSARGSGFQPSRERGPRREEPDIDWSAARGSGFQPSRERAQRREEPDIDWSAARGSGFQPSRERAPRREEPDIDWSAARGSGFQPSRERAPRREEPDLDWSAARGSGFQASRERKPRKQEPELDWGSARGTHFKQANQAGVKKTPAPSKPTEEQAKIQKSAYDVLRAEEDDEDDSESTEQVSTEKKVDDLTKATGQLNVNEDDGEWEVVGKK
ncbi:Eukaryotic translation initiation factor 4B [Nakaseomyces bracarensis]|uniref:Eukaryotic translation initiation factor 4B n=1 Tax=Nakaseomyces bracarensis TaxID=273131 RepID=A0ABR4NPC0_9SACH